ncbi:MAG TPA: glutathione S-transferase family protein [Alphaproteobacteria bacterium]|nr:glutathione S-transferase family protein [Alphaproteobacteria bacterium]
MSLTLHFHPLSSFCQKALVALYENGTPFTPQLLDPTDTEAVARFRALWPIGKIPVLQDEAAGLTLPEASIIIEYLDRHYPGPAPLLPAEPGLAMQTRLRDRVFDLYVNVPMQKIVTDRLRPEKSRDAYGVAEARAALRTVCDMLEAEMAGRTWATGESFTMADCAAAPSLYYANLVMPLAEAHPNTAAYLDRLMQRPSFARAVEEAAPYRDLFPWD